jgi:hypothetical protein
MSETDAAPAAATPAPPPSAAAPAGRPAPPAPPAVPSEAELAEWMGGAEIPSVGGLFSRLTLKTFDALVMQIRKEEMLPQHWQVIAAPAAPPEAEFDSLPEIGRLRLHYRDQELSRRRLANLRLAWRELRGKRPSLWSVPDLFAALRRIYEKGHRVDFYELLSAARDVWRSSAMPAARGHLDMLWACLDFARQKAKK